MDIVSAKHLSLFGGTARRSTNGPRAQSRPGARFSKARKTFRARKAIFSSSVSKNGEVYMPETLIILRICE